MVHVVRWQKPEPPTEQEAEARLQQEGYDVFRWHDVAGSHYPRHRHVHDECLWILKGDLVLTVDDNKYTLKPGDRLYLPARTPHLADAPTDRSVTYLVGQKR